MSASMNTSMNTSYRSDDTSWDERRNSGDDVLRQIVYEQHSADLGSTPHGSDASKLVLHSRPKNTEVQSAGPKKRPGHTRKHSM